MAKIETFENQATTANVDLQKIQGSKIFIATPCYGGVVTEEYHRSMINLTNILIFNKIDYVTMTLANESLVTRARNTLASIFLAHDDCTHLLFIDADISFHWESVLQLIEHDKEVVVGAYPKKGIEWATLYNTVKSGNISVAEMEEYSTSYALNFIVEDGNKLVTEGSLIKLKDAGTGFMLIKREVFEKFINNCPNIEYINDINIDELLSSTFYAFFDTSIDEESKRYLSEDYTFCRRWQKLGGDIWLDPNIKLNHIGHHAFSGNTKTLFGIVN
jgi:hypothetical protein|tara:strand:+ start:518 stop:1339 length:822 start_codon:yes stop_codon:yes gene_type:complete